MPILRFGPELELRRNERHVYDRDIARRKSDSIESGGRAETLLVRLPGAKCQIPSSE
jgi:hypothetical protein